MADPTDSQVLGARGDAFSQLGRHPTTHSSKMDTYGSFKNTLGFCCMGKGSGGTVWKVPDSKIAIKTSNELTNDKAGLLPLWKDYHLTSRAHNAFIQAELMTELRSYRKQMNISVPCVPKPQEFYAHDEDGEGWWSKNRSRFPTIDTDHNGEFISLPTEKTYAFTTQRIPPLPENVCCSLIDAFFDANDVEDALEDEDNEDCLIRVYLGEERPAHDRKTSLRNFELYRDMVHHVNLDVEQWVRGQAYGLACCIGLQT